MFILTAFKFPQKAGGSPTASIGKRMSVLQYSILLSFFTEGEITAKDQGTVHFSQFCMTYKITYQISYFHDMDIILWFKYLLITDACVERDFLIFIFHS